MPGKDGKSERRILHKSLAESGRFTIFWLVNKHTNVKNGLSLIVYQSLQIIMRLKQWY